MRTEWASAKRLVVKIGSSLLVDSASGALKAKWLGSLCDDIAALKAQGKEVIIVSSGAIALGRNVLKLPKGPLKLEDSQAAAAVGQIALAHAYEDAFRALNYSTYFATTDGTVSCCGSGYHNPNWFDDGYGDYVRHYLRAMASAPELAPRRQNQAATSPRQGSRRRLADAGGGPGDQRHTALEP